jgi:AcrR family transcriptional regulator
MDHLRMDHSEFDRALIGAAFALAAQDGWDAVSVAAAAREAGLNLAEARERFPGRAAILLRFGRIADQAALADPPAQGTVRDRLFYMLMQRLDAMQAQRAGVLALARALPLDPPLALMLDMATRRSMRWLLEAAGVRTHGLRGELRVRALVGIWLWAMRAWRDDDSEDLAKTMNAVDTALGRAERMAGWLGDSERTADAAAAADASFADETSEELPPEPESPPPPGLGED